MLTVRDIATRARVSVNIAYGWCASGELPHYRLGAGGRRGKILIAEDDWAAFLAVRRAGGTSPLPPVPAPALPGAAPPLRHVRVPPGDSQPPS